MKVACFFDSQEDLDKVRDALTSKGHECIPILVGKYPPKAEAWHRTLGSYTKDVVEEADAIITGLFFNTDPRKIREEKPPAGLLVVIEAAHQGKPVLICVEGGHHNERVSWIYDGFIGHRYREARDLLLWLSDYKESQSWPKRAMEDLDLLLEIARGEE